MSGSREALDQHLAAVGEDVILRRLAGTSPGDTHRDVTCRALVRAWRLKAENQASGIKQQLWVVIISPTEIFNTNWPAASAALVPSPQLPRRLDQMLFHGTSHTIEAVDPIFVAGDLVRIEVTCLG